MALPQLEQQTKHSYVEYVTWDEGRWELIDGEVWDMPSAPSRLHQAVSMSLSSLLYESLKGKSCAVYAAPFDVRLADEEPGKDYETFTVVQPDISIICDPGKLDDRGCAGAPDLIVEILSPSTAAKDLKVKRALYEQHGVKEYWLVHPTDKMVMVYLAGADGQYAKAQIYDREETLGLVPLGSIVNKCYIRALHLCEHASSTLSGAIIERKQGNILFLQMLRRLSIPCWLLTVTTMIQQLALRTERNQCHEKPPMGILHSETTDLKRKSAKCLDVV